MTHVSPSTASSPALPLAALIHPQPAKRAWHSSIDTVARRTVLLHILVLLKTKYGKVDAKISYIARRAELALYSQAFSAWEYRNPQTLSRRLHSLVVKLHLNNLAMKEDEAFAVEETQMQTLFARTRTIEEEATHHGGVETRLQKRRRGVPERGSAKRQHVAENAYVTQATSTNTSTSTPSLLFFDGNNDLLQHVTSFLDAKDILRCSATCTTANRILPRLVTSIDVSTRAMNTLSFGNRALFFAKFPNLENFTLFGCKTHAQQFDFQNEAKFISRNVVVRSLLASLSHTSLPKLHRFGLDYAYMEGLQDRITSQVSSVLLASSHRFPRLQELSLRGNGISDDGVIFLTDALALLPVSASSAAKGTNPRSHPLRELNLEQNFIGERGFLQLKDTATLFATRGRSAVIRMKDNLIAPSA